MAVEQGSVPIADEPSMQMAPLHPQAAAPSQLGIDLPLLDESDSPVATAHQADGAESAMPMLPQTDGLGSNAPILTLPSTHATTSQGRAAPPPVSPASGWITLDLGGTIMKAPRSVVEKSPGLKLALSHLSDDGGPLLVHADPEIFKHILDHLRNGGFPLFWNKTDGFDFPRYQRLQQDAELFQLYELRDWIGDQKYLNAIKTVYEESVQELEAGMKFEAAGNVDVERRVCTRMIQMYICPRAIPVHRVVRGEPICCGKECRKYLGDRTEDYEDVPFTEVVTLKKTYVFDPKVCMRKGGEKNTGAEKSEREWVI